MYCSSGCLHANEAEFDSWKPFLRKVNNHLQVHMKSCSLFRLPKFRCHCLYFSFTSMWATKQGTLLLLIQIYYFFYYRRCRSFSWWWRASILSWNTSLLVQSALRNHSKVDYYGLLFCLLWKNLAFPLPVALLIFIQSFLIVSMLFR